MAPRGAPAASTTQPRRASSRWRWTSRATSRSGPASARSSPKQAVSTFWSTAPATAPTVRWRTSLWTRSVARPKSTCSGREALSDCLRLETKPFGIDVVIVEPGNIRTAGNTVTAAELQEASGAGPCAAQAAAVLAALNSEANARRESPPSVIADAIAEAVTARTPKTRYAAGFGARPLITLRGMVSDRMFDSLMNRAIGIRRQPQA